MRPSHLQSLDIFQLLKLASVILLNYSSDEMPIQIHHLSSCKQFANKHEQFHEQVLLWPNWFYVISFRLIACLSWRLMFARWFLCFAISLVDIANITKGYTKDEITFTRSIALRVEGWINITAAHHTSSLCEYTYLTNFYFTWPIWR